MRLEELASIRGGIILSRKLAPEKTRYQYQQVTLKSISAQGVIDASLFEQYFAIEPLKEEYFTRKGDILVRLSAPYTTVLITDAAEGLLISSNFAVIRVTSPRICPEYLAWLLNTPQVKRDILKNVTGTALASINADYYRKIKLNPLPCEQQQQFLTLHQLAAREIELLEELLATKKEYNARMEQSAHNQINEGVSL